MKVVAQFLARMVNKMQKNVRRMEDVLELLGKKKEMWQLEELG